MGRFLRSLFGLVVRIFRRRPVTTAPLPVVAQPVRRVDAGLYVAFSFLVVGIMLGFLYSWAWVCGGLLGAIAVFASTGMEVVQPDRAGYMRFGRYRGAVDPGWHFPIKGIMECCHRPGKDLRLDLGEMKVFTKRKTAVTAKVTVYYRLGPTDVDLENACLYLPKDFTEAEVMFRDAAESEVRSVLGTEDFGGLIPEQERLEEMAKTKIADDYKKWGFVMVGVKIRDFDEETESEAARIRIQGLAEADVREANARILKDNWQAAAVTIGDSFARAYLSGGKGKKKETSSQEEEKEGEDAQNPLTAAVQGVAQAVRGAVGGRGKRRP